MDLGSLGVAPRYTDAFGIVRELDATTRAALVERFSHASSVGEPIVLAPGEGDDRIEGTLRLEDGTLIRAASRIDQVGYHVLFRDDGVRHLVLVAPPQLPQPPRGYGIAVQLYAARGHASWGIGDFADLATLAREAGTRGAQMLLVSPIHAMAPVVPAPNSPYSPASRLWLNTLHIAIDAVPGAEVVDLADLRRDGLALNARRRIDRDAVTRLKNAALERIWAVTRAEEPVAFRSWVQDQGAGLATFATWCTLAEAFGANWQAWPQEYRHPDSEAVQAFAAAHADRVRFHQWTQWVADLQVERACGSGVDVCLDIAVGFDTTSADGWMYQDLLCLDFEVGCPADRNNIDGQRWGLPPFDPHALVAADLEPFVRTVRASLRHAGALRMDHVMQLWRLFWIPRWAGCHEGAYVHYPTEAMLAVIRIEASRSGAWVVGEDMGTLVPGARDRMHQMGMLGYRCATRTPPEGNDEQTVGASSTHDQATVAGLLTGQDMLDMVAIGKHFTASQYEDIRRDLAARAGVDLTQPVGPEEIRRAVVAQYRRLTTSPSRIVLVTGEDLAGVAERPNMPGTVDEWPNWRIASPVAVEDLLSTPLAVEVLDVVAHDRLCGPAEGAQAAA